MSTISNYSLQVNLFRPLPLSYAEERENVHHLIREECSGSDSEGESQEEVVAQKKNYLWKMINLTVKNAQSSPYIHVEDLFHFYANLLTITRQFFFKDLVSRVQVLTMETAILDKIREKFKNCMNLMFLQANERFKACLQIQNLQEPRWSLVEKPPVEMFSKCFQEESVNQYKMVEAVKGIDPELVGQFLKSFLCFKNLPFSERKQQEVSQEIKDFKIDLGKQAKYLADFIKKFQARYAFCISMLDHRHLGLRKPLPLKDYNFNRDQYYQTNQELLGKLFFLVPKRLPVDVVNILENSIEPKRAHSLDIFILLRLKYFELRQSHVQIREAMPEKYPFMMPNLMRIDGKPDLEVKDENQFRQLISAYVSHFNNAERILNILRGLHNEKIELLEELS